MATHAEVDRKVLARLVEAARVLAEQQAAILRELDALAAGRPGIGHQIRAVQAGFDAVWCVRYAPGAEKCYVWSHTKDGASIKRLLRTLTVDEVLARAARYLANDDAFYVRARHGFAVFVATINAHTTPSPRREISAVGCHHEPACLSDADHTSRQMAELAL